MQSAPIQLVETHSGAQALLDPFRRRLLAELAEPESATGLSKRLGIPRQRLNYHLKQLESEGLVELVEERRKRNCVERVLRAVARSYVISPAVLGRLAADPAAVRDHASSAYLVATAARTITEVAALREGASEAGKKLATLTIQSDVRFASPEALRAFTDELTEVLGRLVAKYHDERADAGRAFRLSVAAYPKPPAASDE